MKPDCLRYVQTLHRLELEVKFSCAVKDEFKRGWVVLDHVQGVWRVLNEAILEQRH